MTLLSIFSHHSEPGDPVLLAWVRHQIDALLGLGPGAVAAALGLVVVAIPVAIMVAYILHRPR